MKNKLGKNLGLKVFSVVAAFLLWLIVVNVDDPVISRTYAGISVEILNEDLIEKEGKCYEVLEGTDTINVVVTAKRSVLDSMSRDYIKATADFKSLTFLDTLPIEVKSTRFSDKIDSVTTRTENVKLKLENLIEKSVPVRVDYEGEVAEGSYLVSVDSKVKEIAIYGPESLVNEIDYAGAQVSVEGLSSDITLTQRVALYDAQNRVVENSKINIVTTNVDLGITINGTKEIPINCGFSGTPANGYATTGIVSTNPSSVVVTGRGENYDDMGVIYISPDVVNVDNATQDVVKKVDISDYLPTGVFFADSDFIPEVDVTVGVDATKRKIISVPLSNITINNLPDGYIANIVDIGGAIDVEIQGLGDTFERYSGDLAIGSIDATRLVSSSADPDAQSLTIYTGENEGQVYFDLPNGISLTQNITLRVIVDYIGDAEDIGQLSETETDGSAKSGADVNGENAATPGDDLESASSEDSSEEKLTPVHDKADDTIESNDVTESDEQPDEKTDNMIGVY